MGQEERPQPPAGQKQIELPAGDSARNMAVKKQLLPLGGAVAALLTLLFFLLFWNRFLGFRSGDGGYSAGVFFLHGILPYRDYFNMAPPLFLVRCTAVLSIFGQTPIALRGFGVFERILLALLLYGWLARLFRVKDAVLATLVTVVVSSGDIADPISSYNHFTILLAIASGWLASLALDEERSYRAVAWMGAASGIVSLLCFGSKQTIGLGITVGIPTLIGLCLARLDGLRRALHFLGGYLAGWTAAAGILLAWMIHDGLLKAFLIQAFVVGPQAKRLGDYFARSWLVLSENWWAAAIAIAILTAAWSALSRAQQHEQHDSFSESLRGVLFVMLLGTGAIIAARFLDLPLSSLFFAAPAKPLIYLSLAGSGLLLIYYFCLFLNGNLSRRQTRFALIALVSFLCAFMTSLSYPAFEAMCVPGLALFLAAFLNEYAHWRRWILYAVCTLLIFCQGTSKRMIPFGFDGWYEPPVSNATATSTLPELHGLLLPATTIGFVDTTVQIIREHSTPEDTIFVYPEFGILYGLTGRRAPTFSLSHNIDVAPDSFDRQEAERLLAAPPAVLVYGVNSRELLLSDERLWRGGKASGLRDLEAAVQQLAKQYQLMASFRMYPFGDPVYVLVRPDRVNPSVR